MGPVYRAGFESPVPDLNRVNLDDGVSRASLAPAIAHIEAQGYDPERFSEQSPERRKELWQEALRNAQARVKIEARSVLDQMDAAKRDLWRVPSLLRRLDAFQGPLSVYLDEGEQKQVGQAHTELSRLHAENIEESMRRIQAALKTSRADHVILHPALMEHEAYRRPWLWRAKVRFGLLPQVPLEPTLPDVAKWGSAVGALMALSSIFWGYPAVNLSVFLGVGGFMGAIGAKASAMLFKMIYEHHLGQAWPGWFDRLAAKSARYGAMASLAGFTAALLAYFAAFL